jgi:hypothetical protein
VAVYTVHEPPVGSQTSVPDPERFVFVRDGFSFAAFLFGPLWMLWYRMWLVLLGYVLLAAALEAALRSVGASTGATALIGLLLGLLIGFEAPTLRRFSLGRRKWSNVGIIVGDNLESAEQRFFDGWAKPVRAGSSATYGAPGARARQAEPTEPEIVGLFPDAGGHH